MWQDPATHGVRMAGACGEGYGCCVACMPCVAASICLPMPPMPPMAHASHLILYLGQCKNLDIADYVPEAAQVHTQHTGAYWGAGGDMAHAVGPPMQVRGVQVR